MIFCRSPDLPEEANLYKLKTYFNPIVSIHVKERHKCLLLFIIKEKHEL